MMGANTNPAGNPKLKELKRRERPSDAQRTGDLEKVAKAPLKDQRRRPEKK
jgi:hypothetical protein